MTTFSQRFPCLLIGWICGLASWAGAEPTSPQTAPAPQIRSPWTIASVEGAVTVYSPPAQTSPALAGMELPQGWLLLTSVGAVAVLELQGPDKVSGTVSAASLVSAVRNPAGQPGLWVLKGTALLSGDPTQDTIWLHGGRVWYLGVGDMDRSQDKVLDNDAIIRELLAANQVDPIIDDLEEQARRNLDAGWQTVVELERSMLILRGLTGILPGASVSPVFLPTLELIPARRAP